MPVIEYSEQNKYQKLFKFFEKTKNKIFLISIFINIFLIFIFLFLLIWIEPYFLYGSLYGTFWLIISYFFINFFEKIFSKKKIINFYSIFIFSIRFFVFLISFLILIFLLNPLIFNQKGVKLLWEPINLFSYLFSYYMFSFSTFLLPFLDFFIKKLKDKKIKEDYFKTVV